MLKRQTVTETDDRLGEQQKSHELELLKDMPPEYGD